MRTFKIFSFIGLALLLAFHNTVSTGCRKPEEAVKTDTIAPPPPPPADTVTLIKQLEIFTSLYPSYSIVKYRTYSFYYDTQKRLKIVGFRNHTLNPADSFTTKIDYNNNSKLPERIIMPDLLSSGAAPVYDTTWFFNAGNKIQKDSANERVYDFTTSSFVRKPIYRIYSYPDSATLKIDWFWSMSSSQTPELARRDTVKFTATGKPGSIKSQFDNYPPNGFLTYALADAFTFSEYINPLSKLNISGTPYSLIYAGVRKEILGNSSHPTVYNSNGWADYLDFLSPNLPSLFYIGAYNRLHQMVNSGAAAFIVEISPWSQRPAYPSEIKVSISTSLVGDKFIYRYTY